MRNLRRKYTSRYMRNNHNPTEMMQNACPGTYALKQVNARKVLPYSSNTYLVIGLGSGWSGREQSGTVLTFWAHVTPMQIKPRIAAGWALAADFFWLLLVMTRALLMHKTEKNRSVH